MNGTAIENRNQIQAIKLQLATGDISYERAKILAAPIIKRINDKSVKLAKKYGIKPRLVDFASLMR